MERISGVLPMWVKMPDGETMNAEAHGCEGLIV